MDHKLSATLELKDKFTSKLKKAAALTSNFVKSNIKARSALRETTNSLKTGISTLNSYVKVAGAIVIGKTLVSSAATFVNAFADLEYQVKRNKAIMGATAEQEATLMKQTRELGRSTKFTAQEVAQAQMYQAMAGLKTNEVLELTPKLLKLSIASGEDLAKTSDILTDNMSAFGLKLQEADRFMDILTATANNTNTTISELGEAYQYVAATSRNFESLEEVNILLGILADNGIKGAKAGRNLASVYARLSKTTPEMDKAFKKVGISIYDKNKKFKGLRNILKESKEALSKMTDEQRNYWLTTVAGTEGFKVFASILGYSAEGIAKVEKGIKNAKGSTEKMAEEMGNSTKNKVEKFKSALDDLKISLGEGLAPAATEFMNDFIKKINELNEKGVLDKTNIESYFESTMAYIKEAIYGYGALKLAVAAAGAHPVFGAAIGMIYAAVRFAKHQNNEIYKNRKIEIEKLNQEREFKYSLQKKYREEGLSYYDSSKKAEEVINRAKVEKRNDDLKYQYRNIDGLLEYDSGYNSKNINQYVNDNLGFQTVKSSKVENTNNISVDLGGVNIYHSADISEVTKAVEEKLSSELNTLYQMQQ